MVFPNSTLVDSNIKNYKKMNERRVVFMFGLTYDSNQNILKDVPLWTKEIIESIESCRFDRAHFKQFGDSSLDFEVVYYVLSADFNYYMDVQQEINFRLRDKLSAAGLSFAFPTRTIDIDPGLFRNEPIAQYTKNMTP